MPASLTLIVAYSTNRVIGRDNALPWKLPGDLAHFKRSTLGHPIIMGRKTWDSLPPRFRPLPGRTNIVVTRQTDWHAEGARRATSLPDALAQCDAGQTVWIIGGAQIYAEALPLADRLEVTEIGHVFEGDAYAPALGTEWVVAQRSEHLSAQGWPFSFVSYVRAP